MGRKDCWGMAFFILLVLAVSFLTSRIDIAGQNSETELVRNAVKNAAVTCYAVEGVYPSELSYIRDQYGLAYDENRYLVFYDAFASNILPDIRVVQIGEGTP